MLAAALALFLADTPEAALKEFVAAWNRGDAVAAAKFVDGTDPKEKFTELTTMLRGKGKWTPTVAVTSIRRRGDRLIANVGLKGGFSGGQTTVKDDTINMVERPDGWKLVAPQEPNYQSLLGGMAGLLRDWVKNTKAATEKMVALSNMKQIALGTLRYAGDWDDVLKMSPATAKEKITPYMKHREVFKDPATGKTDAYVFNNRLTNVPLRHVKHPAETVLWSLGTQGALRYLYGGRTLIAFVDGHVKSMGEEEAAKLRWTPDR